MSQEPQIPRVPNGTGAGGRALWRAVLADFDLDEHEMALLREAVRTVDQLDALYDAADTVVVDGGKGPRAHPALVEARQQRIVLARLLAALRLPSGDEAEQRPQRRQGVRGFYQPQSRRQLNAVR